MMIVPANATGLRARVASRGWVVISMKNGWKRVVAFEP
jgi:hypothetical protein